MTTQRILALFLALATAGLLIAGTLARSVMLLGGASLAGFATLCCLLLVVYRHAVALRNECRDLKDTLRRSVTTQRGLARSQDRQLAALAEVASKHEKALANIATGMAEAHSARTEARRQLHAMEEIIRLASRQSADVQHMVLGSFRSLSQVVDEIQQRTRDESKAAKRVAEEVTQGVAGVRNEVVQLKDEVAAAKNKIAKVKDDVAAARNQVAGVTEGIAKVAGDIPRSRTETLHETEAMLQLMHLLRPSAVVPFLGGWAMEASTMLALVNLILREKPATVVECGSGTSSVWIAYALQRNGSGRLVSLEHEQAFGEATARALRQHALDHLVELRIAPLREVTLGGEVFPWYDVGDPASIGPIDVLVVDGPPSSTGPMSRYPAVPVFEAQLRPGAIVVLDDANRKDEKAVMKRWREELPQLGEPAPLASRTVLMNVGDASR